MHACVVVVGGGASIHPSTTGGIQSWFDVNMYCMHCTAGEQYALVQDDACWVSQAVVVVAEGSSTGQAQVCVHACVIHVHAVQM